MADNNPKQGGRVEITKGERTGQHGEVTDPGVYITQVRVDGEEYPRPIMNHELKEEGK